LANRSITLRFSGDLLFRRRSLSSGLTALVEWSQVFPPFHGRGERVFAGVGHVSRVDFQRKLTIDWGDA
jgi:hypothetical protein